MLFIVFYLFSELWARKEFVFCIIKNGSYVLLEIEIINVFFIFISLICL